MSHMSRQSVLSSPISSSASSSSSSNSSGLTSDPSHSTGPNVNYNTPSTSVPQSFSNHYKQLEYLTNYTPILNVIQDKIRPSKIKKENELLLYKYYRTKKQLQFPLLETNKTNDTVQRSARNNSPNSTDSFATANKNRDLTSSPEISPASHINDPSAVTTGPTAGEKLAASSVVDEFRAFQANEIDPQELRYAIMRHDVSDIKNRRESFVSKHLNRTTSSLAMSRFGGFMDDGSLTATDFLKNNDGVEYGLGTTTITEHHLASGNDDNKSGAETTKQKHSQNGKRDPHSFYVNADFTSPYFKYFKKLLTVNLKDSNVLKKHNLWVPTIANDIQALVMGTPRSPADEYLRGLYTNKTSPLFVSNPRYIPSFFDAQSGSTILPSVFSEYKLPPLTYHCSIEFNDQVIIIGGLMPCYRNNAEIPDLSKFYVDGIKNLPPPLLPELINNPAMINNPHIYSYSVSSSRISRLEVTGFPPPPLLCMTASKLTERHICFYGGFEVTTESKYDEKKDRMYIRRSAFLNNTVYILDTVSFKFTKVEVIAQPYQSPKYPGFFPRFGHMQISVSNMMMMDTVSPAKADAEGDHTSHSVLSTTPTKTGSSTTETDTKTTKPTGNNNTLPPNDAVVSPITTSKQTSGALQQSRSEDQTSGNPVVHPPLLKNTSNNSIGMASGTGTNSSSHQPPRMYTILIFGGYKQTGDDKYEAMNDMWRLDLNVSARGKKGYLKFADTVTAVRVPVSSDETAWPSCRAFFAYARPDVKLFGKSTLESDLLKRLDEGFRIEYDFIDDYYQKSRPLSSGIHHAYGGGNSSSSNGGPSTITTTTATTTTSNIGTNPILDGSNKRNSVGHASKMDDVNNSGSNYNFNTGSRAPTTSTIQPVSQRLSDGKPLHLEQDGRGRKFIIHGGASNTEVFGDMWCFDLDTLKWSKFRTGIPPDNHGDTSCFLTKDRSIKLVGHTMIPSGSSGICVGGLSQEAVDHIFKRNSSTGNAIPYKKPKFGNSFINVFDLNSEYLKIRKSFSSDQDREWLYLADDLSDSFTEAYATEYDVISATGSVTESHGSILIVGGCMIFRHRIDEIFLRGALIEFPLPTMSRAQFY